MIMTVPTATARLTGRAVSSPTVVLLLWAVNTVIKQGRHTTSENDSA